MGVQINKSSTSGGGSNATVSVQNDVLVHWASGATVAVVGNITSSPTIFAGAPFPVTDNNSSLTVDFASGATVTVVGTMTSSPTIFAGAPFPVTQSGTWDEVGINDSGNSITVDWVSGATVSVVGTLTSSPTIFAGDVFPVSQSGTWDEVGINDSGNSITVDNAGLTELAAAINASSQMDVNIAANGIGLSTAANQSTANTSLNNIDQNTNGIETLLVAIGTYTDTTASAIAGGHMQVDVVGALPVGANAIGKLAANDGVDIGDVSINNTISSVATVNPGSAFPVTDNSGSLTVDWLSGATVSVASLPNVSVTNILSSLATVNNFPATYPVTQSGTWDEVGINDSGNSITVDWVSGATVSIVGTLSSSPTVFAGAAFPVTDNGGALTVDGTVAVSSLPEVTSLATVTAASAFPVTDNSSSLTVDWLSGATVSVASLPNVSVTNIISSLATVNNFPAAYPVTQSGSWDEVGVNDSGNSLTVDFLSGATVSVASLPNVSVTNIVSSLATVNNFPATYPVTQSGTWDEVGINDSGNSITVDWASGATVSIVGTLSSSPTVFAGDVFPVNDNGSSLTVDGTVAVSSLPLVTSLATINNFPATYPVTQSGTWDEVGVNDSGNSLTVDWISGATVSVAALPAVTVSNVLSSLATVTAASAFPVTGTFWQATQPISVASIPSHEVTNAGTFATQATLQTGAAAIGKLAANSGVDIGDVDITSIAAGDNNIGNVDVVTMPQPTPPSTIVAFQTDIPTAGTRVQLGSNAVNGVVIQAPSTNTGLIYVGGSNVSSTVKGAELQAGQSTGLAIDNTNKIYVDASVSGDDVMILGS